MGFEGRVEGMSDEGCVETRGRWEFRGGGDIHTVKGQDAGASRDSLPVNRESERGS